MAARSFEDDGAKKSFARAYPPAWVTRAGRVGHSRRHRGVLITVVELRFNLWKRTLPCTPPPGQLSVLTLVSLIGVHSAQQTPDQTRQLCQFFVLWDYLPSRQSALQTNVLALLRMFWC